MYRFPLTTLPKAKLPFQLVPVTVDDSDSDSEDEAPKDVYTSTDRACADSIKLCQKLLKRAQPTVGLHYGNPDVETGLPLDGLPKNSPSLFLEICPTGTTNNSDTCEISLCQDKKPVLTVLFKIHLRRPRDPMPDCDDRFVSKLTLQAVKAGRKTVSVPEDAFTFLPRHHHCLCIRNGNNSIKVLVNREVAALINGPLSELTRPLDLVVTKGIAVKSVDIPMEFVPDIVKAPFKGNMQVGDRINVFGEQRMDCEQETTLLTLGDLVVPYNRDTKTGKTRIVIQRFTKCLVAFCNGKNVVTCRTPEKFNTSADLVISKALNPNGIWIARMAGN
ncbi:uncharacterized protein LOC135383566 [Ornithodoros turicata]|uniref:uncharacterized protein LOC135383566 n=1 Tax=Ornithodoros turicata TaxID=34597 RepID=UPI003139E987